MKKRDDAKEVKDFFHSYAADFDAIYGRTSKTGFLGRSIDRMFRQAMFKRMVETLENTSKENIQSVLDVGCGPGRYTVEFLKQGKKVVALDMAQGMIEVAKSAVKEAEITDNIEFVVNDYLQSKFDEKFNAACLMGFFDYIEKPVLVFKKLKNEITKEIYASFPKAGGPLVFQRRIRYWMKKCPLYFYTYEDVQKVLNEAGYEGKYEIQDFGRDFFVKVTF